MSEFSFNNRQKPHRAYSGQAPSNFREALNSNFNSYLHNSLNGGFQGVMGIPEAWMYGNGGDSNPPTTGGNDPGLDPNDPNKFAWTFPQYSQTWAFTPPTPSPYFYPKPFDTSIYGNPLSKKA